MGRHPTLGPLRFDEIPGVYHVFLLIAGLSLHLPALPDGQSSSSERNDRGDYLSARLEQRVIKSIDFDERTFNFEPVPMNWNPVVEPGYPRYLQAVFDDNVGHAAPPSFYFAIQGGSLGSYYLAKDIPVHAGSDYRITGWIRPRGLKHSGARVTAYFLDHALRKIPESERRSEVVRDASSEGTWQQVVIDLPGRFAHAGWIGLSCRVERRSPGGAKNELFRPVDYQDIHGAAWFDDISVMRLPKVGLALNAPSNVFTAGRPTVISVRMADLNGAGLQIDLDVQDASGRTVETHRLSGAELISDQGVAVRLKDLPAGLYVARLTTRVDERVASTHELTFLRLNPDLGGAGRGTQGFGIVADASLFAHRELAAQLLQFLSPGIVKLPLWRADLGPKAIVTGDFSAGELVNALHRMGVTVVGVLDSVPDVLAEQFGPTERSLLSVLASNPDRWRPYLALILTRYGHRINAWQLGPEAGPALDERTRLPRALNNIRSEMRPLIGTPRLVVPRSSRYAAAEDALPADVFSLSIPSGYSADLLHEQEDRSTGPSLASRWATIDSASPHRYDRQWRLIDFARRLVVARSSGMDSAFTPQPWRFDDSKDRTIVEPFEEFILLRTLNQALGGMVFDQTLWAGPGVEARLFVKPDQQDVGALVLWTEARGRQPTKIVMDLGAEPNRVDLWANVEDPPTVQDGREFTVDAMPMIIRPVEPWRVRMLAGFRLDDATFQPTVREHVRTLSLTNPHVFKLNAVLRLEVPIGWRVRPTDLSVEIPSGRSERFEVRFRIPSNEPVGGYELRGRLRVDGEDFSDMTLRAPMRVDASALDVNVLAYREGQVVKVMQRITNLTDRNLNLRAYVLAPHHARDVRLIRDLSAGRTVVREYEIGGAANLVGEHIRVSVEQIDGPLRQNTVIRLDP